MNKLPSVKDLVVDFGVGNLIGSCSVLVGYPFDSLKVRMQTSSNHSSMVKTMFEITKKEGILGLFRGMMFPFFLEGLNCACLFGTFQSLEFFRAHFAAKNDDGKKQSYSRVKDLAAIMSTSGLAGLVYACVGTPTDLFKIQLQANRALHPNEKSKPIDLVKKVFKERGIGGIYHGLTAACLLNISYCTAYFTTYTLLRRNLVKRFGTSENIPKLYTFFSGSLVGMFSLLLTIPLDNLNSKVKSDFKMTISKAFQSTSLRESYKGLLPCLMRAAIVHGSVFFLWDKLNRVLHGGNNK